MGLFKRSKGPNPIDQMKSAGGNFKYIAQTMATQYFILSQTDYAWMISAEQRLYATALMNAFPAVQAGDISMHDLSSAVEDSILSRVFLGEYTQSHGLWVDSEFDRLCNLILQVEALVFKAYTAENDRIIAESVIQNKPEIVSIVKRTLQQGKKSPLYLQLLPNVTGMINDHVFRYLVEVFDTLIELQDREIELINEIRSLTDDE